MWVIIFSALFCLSASQSVSPVTATDFPVTTEVQSRAPTITVGLSSLTVPEYGTAQFRCVASGVPTPTIVISSLADSRIPDLTELAGLDQDSNVSQQEGLLVITNVTAKEHGAGGYRCIAYNSAGYDISDASLVVRDVCEEVECRGQRVCVPVYETASYECLCLKQECSTDFLPVCGSDCVIHFNPCMWNNSACDNDYPTDIIGTGTECPETSAPFVKINRRDQNVVEGSDITLEVVELMGFPVPVVTWYQTDISGSKIKVGTGKKFTISSALPEHSGQYYCEAVNCGNETHTSSVVNVFVRAAPKPTKNQRVCSVFGDPHVLTFDGMKYKAGGECHYVLAMECVSIDWIIYGEFEPCGRGSCLSQISLYHKRDAVIVGRGWLVSYRGVKTSFKQGKDFQIGSLDFSFDGLYLKIAIPESGITLVYDGAMSLQIALDMGLDGDKRPLCGLCGNNDGDDSNEAIQMRSIGNEVTGSTLEDFVQTWKVDRGGYCQKPGPLSFDRRQPCGNQYRKNEAAVQACQQIIDNQELYKCHKTVNMNIFYEACLFDYCGVELMSEEYPVHCAVASSYAKHCQLLGVGIEDEVWRREMTCPDISVTQQAILGNGCPQLESPLA